MPDHIKDTLLVVFIVALMSTWVVVSIWDKLTAVDHGTEKRCAEKLSGCD